MSPLAPTSLYSLRLIPPEIPLAALVNKLRQLLKILKHLERKIGTKCELLDRQILRLDRVGDGAFHQKF